MITKVLIKKVEKGAVYNDLVYDYWVTCCLLDNSEIVLFDPKPHDLTDLLNQWVEINIKALFFEQSANADLRSFQGKIVRRDNGYFFVSNYINIEVKREDVINNKTELEFENRFYFGRLDIVNVLLR
ncbi:hypothetical protein EZV76_04110 [Flagellimonas alvinocaridis]|uniref:Uncharacterized protein n=1 Tax=Flagellimonas alvinocaridis TaxID=2530200 RepID=A0A4S8RUH1_9FLAO|nr:hypothetical protein [Allomuricauda alvinocaridis]THV61521.1 hypothetical protein EZV76_04110 [Allomuricauda alvinocaridis]